MKNQTNQTINKMCENCYQRINGECNGTTNQHWTGCAYRKEAPTENTTQEEVKKENYTISKNAVYNSYEVAFSEKPSESIRKGIKALKFRYNPKKNIWYGYYLYLINV